MTPRHPLEGRHVEVSLKGSVAPVHGILKAADAAWVTLLIEHYGRASETKSWPTGSVVEIRDRGEVRRW